MLKTTAKYKYYQMHSIEQKTTAKAKTAPIPDERNLACCLNCTDLNCKGKCGKLRFNTSNYPKLAT